MKEQNFWIQQLQLKPHPEGGYYREVYRSTEQIAKQALPERYATDHCFSTSIYFLLPADSFSAFHRLKSDEIWHFYLGDSVTLFLLTEDGKLHTRRLGNLVEQGEQLQLVIPHGVWFAAQVSHPQHGYALLGCTVAPGFEFADFELANQQQLLNQFPQHEKIIKRLTRP